MLMSGLPLAPFLLLITNYNGNTGTTGVEHEDLPEDVGVLAPFEFVWPLWTGDSTAGQP